MVMFEIEMSLTATGTVAILKNSLAVRLSIATSGLRGDRVWL